MDQIKLYYFDIFMDTGIGYASNYNPQNSP